MSIFHGQHKHCFWFDLPPLGIESPFSQARRLSVSALLSRVEGPRALLLRTSTLPPIVGDLQLVTASSWSLMKWLERHQLFTLSLSSIPPPLTPLSPPAT